MRKLASIRIIDKVEPIPGADRIEKATIDGWTVVVGKGLFKAGDRAVYCEIDSALPVVTNKKLDRDGSLAKRGLKTAHQTGEQYHVLKTIKLRGVYSQGLLLNVDVLKPETLLEKMKFAISRKTYTPGDDVSKDLGIIKYDRFDYPFAKSDLQKNDPLSVLQQRIFQSKVGRILFNRKGKTMKGANSNLVGPFPSAFARKSDSERIQNLYDHWEEIQKHQWYATEKLDGQSVTLINDGGTLRVASRNYEVLHHDALDYAIDQGFMDEVPEGYAVQGEWVGPGVNGNTLGLEEHMFFVFDVFKNGKRCVEWPEWAIFRRVPFLGNVANVNESSPEEVLASVDGMKSAVVKSELAEGVVYHTVHGEELECLENRSTFKAISNKWLIKKG